MLKKLSQTELDELLHKFCDAILSESQLMVREIILFGSYARGDADNESDVDLMILTDLPRERIAECNKVLVHIASNLGLEYGPVVSPTMQNYDFFFQWVNALPFYSNVRHEGVSLHVA